MRTPACLATMLWLAAASATALAQPPPTQPPPGYAPPTPPPPGYAPPAQPPPGYAPPTRPPPARPPPARPPPGYAPPESEPEDGSDETEPSDYPPDDGPPDYPPDDGPPGYPPDDGPYGPGPGYGPPGYGPAGQWPAGYGPSPPPPRRSSCCLWSLRYDPFDLVWRRVTVEAELAWGKLPFTTSLSPAWIFDSPADEVDERGFDIGLDLGWYPGGRPLRGFWVKAHGEYERFTSTVERRDAADNLVGKPNPEKCDADSEPGTCSKTVGSLIVGVQIGSTHVFGQAGGFTISGGIGIGVAIAPPVKLEVLPCTAADVVDGDPHCPGSEPEGSQGVMMSYYDEAGRIRLIGSLGLGVAF